MRIANVVRQDGTKKEYASPALGEEDAHRVVAAIGLGNPYELRNAENLKAAFNQLEIGALMADDARGLVLAPDAELPPKEDRDERVELPIVLDGGKIPDAARDVRSMRLRGAICVAPSGHAVVALAKPTPIVARMLAVTNAPTVFAFTDNAHADTIA